MTKIPTKQQIWWCLQSNFLNIF